ncbi:hypothetical protein WJX75_006043 [Coccomyxa subellipsoidea]|uniref:Uncharacterized protein n=1 Tax=Coccomyxa subellipsoidea TaxID=248742 RepID=A0ABR2YFB5_9CHLO
MRRNRSIRWEDGNIKESSEKPGVSREHPESHDDEEHADPLDALIAELERIEGQQVTIKDAVQHSKPIVVHPRKEDLLSTEFSAPEEAPDEFRSMQYDSERITTLASGVSGTFGEISDPTSQALHDFLRRLQDQANQVRELIANQQTITRSAAVLRKSGGSEQRGGIRAAQGGLQSFEVPVPSPPRVSEGAVSIESKPSKGKAHHLEIVASGLDADATITLTTGIDLHVC